VRELLAKHEPRQLDPAVEKEMREYVAMAGRRSIDDYLAAEWEP
jgi:trimethylamine:corrinoid methyltransferase-like protein